MVYSESTKMVADYRRESFEEVLNLDCYEFKKYLIDAFIYEKKKTPEGRKYLEDCYYARQTKADRKKLLALAKRGV